MQAHTSVMGVAAVCCMGLKWTLQMYVVQEQCFSINFREGENQPQKESGATVQFKRWIGRINLDAVSLYAFYMSMLLKHSRPLS